MKTGVHNWPPEKIASTLARLECLIEASPGITLRDLRRAAAKEVGRISHGMLRHLVEELVRERVRMEWDGSEPRYWPRGGSA